MGERMKLNDFVKYNLKGQIVTWGWEEVPSLLYQWMDTLYIWPIAYISSMAQDITSHIFALRRCRYPFWTLRHAYVQLVYMHFRLFKPFGVGIINPEICQKKKKRKTRTIEKYKRKKLK